MIWVLKRIQNTALWFLISIQSASASTTVHKILSQFVDDGKRYGVDVAESVRPDRLSVRIKSLKSVSRKTIGLCVKGKSRNTITLDTKFWNQVDEIRKETLLYHELGHCVLGRGHTSKRMASGEYVSIMTPYILSEKTYLAHREYYILELFENSKEGLEFNEELP